MKKAINMETTKSDERASKPETTIIDERATAMETPTDGERLTDSVRQSLSVLVRAYYDYQKERIGLDGMLGEKKDGTPKKRIPERDPHFLMILRIRRHSIMRLKDMEQPGDTPGIEESLLLQITQMIHTHPLWKNFLQDVKGCGEGMAAVIITEFDIYKAPTASNLWSFAGLATGKTKGKKIKNGNKIITDDLIPIDKKTKGYLCPFNQFLRAKLCGVLGSSFLKCNSPYRVYYDNMKHRLESKNWGTESKNPTDKKRLKAGHQHKAANRYMIKMFLKDLYVAWRTLEGLPVRPPYAEEYLGKKHTT